MGASPGAIGTARAQYHLRQIGVALNLFILNRPEVIIADAAHRFDENGNLIHEPTKQLIQELLKNLVDWTRRISPAPATSSRHRLNSFSSSSLEGPCVKAINTDRSACRK